MFNFSAQHNAGFRRQQRNLLRMARSRAAWLRNKRHDQFTKALTWMNQS